MSALPLDFWKRCAEQLTDEQADQLAQDAMIHGTMIVRGTFNAANNCIAVERVDPMEMFEEQYELPE